MGGALAVKYALDAIGDNELKRPDRLVLITPMIGITRLARIAGFAALPAMLPAFAKAAWLSVTPEFNPFKYNSFPVNGARQSVRLADALPAQIVQYAREGKLVQLPPILTFQSVVDFTVSTNAIVSALYARLPSNGSELVLFDVNRMVKFGQLLRSSADIALSRILPAGPQKYRTAIITNMDAGTSEVSERVIEAGAATENSRPFGLYPDPAEDFGIHLGALAPRGERNVLIVSTDALLRISFNPFFPYMLGRIEESFAGHASSAVANSAAHN